MRDLKNIIIEAAFEELRPHKTYDTITNYIKYEYFQVYYQPKNPNDAPPYCNVLTIFYKGESICEYCLDEQWPDLDELEEILNMSLEEKREHFFNHYKREIFDNEFAAEVVLDDDKFKPTILKTEQDFLDSIDSWY